MCSIKFPLVHTDIDSVIVVIATVEPKFDITSARLTWATCSLGCAVL